MLYQIFSLLLIIPCLLGYGSFLGDKLAIRKSQSLMMILGLFSLSVAWTILSFFVPITIFVEILSLGLGYFFYFKSKLWKSDFVFYSTKATLFFYVCIVLAIVSSTYYPFILDTFGYYIPSVLWISEYGLVKGIANLDLILGQMSFWHILQAGFSHVSDIYLRLNLLLLIVFVHYIFETKKWIMLVVLPVFFLFTQSPSPDLPVMILSLIVVNEILNKNNNLSFLFAISVWAFAVKPTVIWLPLFVLVYGVFFVNSSKKFLVLGSLVFGLFIIKNIYCFGYPFFPSTFLDVGASWKPNSELMQDSAKYAIIKTYDTQYTYEQITQFSVVEKVKNWLFLDGIKSKIHILFVFSIIIFGFYAFKTKNKVLILLWSCILLKCIIVLMFSAQYRFFLEVFVIIFFILFQSIISKKISFVAFGFIATIVLSTLSFPRYLQIHLPSFRLGAYITGISSEQLIRPVFYELNSYYTYQIGNLKFNVSKDYPFSFDTPLPAISSSFVQHYYDIGIFPQLNSHQLKDGFHWKKLNKEQKEKLKEILKNLPIQ